MKDYFFSDKISSLQPSAIREILKFTADPNVISFAAGNPSAEAFPVDEIERLPAISSLKNPLPLFNTALRRDILLFGTR